MKGLIVLFTKAFSLSNTGLIPTFDIFLSTRDISYLCFIRRHWHLSVRLVDILCQNLFKSNIEGGVVLQNTAEYLYWKLKQKINLKLRYNCIRLQVNSIEV